MGYNSPPGDAIDQLIERIRDLERRARENERPSGTQVSGLVQEVRGLIDDIGTYVNAYLATGFTTGSMTATGTVNVGGNINVTGDLYTPHGRATPVVTSYVAAYIDSVGRLGATPSSMRFKDLLNDYETDIDAFMGITWRRYTYKDDENQTPRVGAWAEDVNESFPELVVHEDGEPYSIHKEDFFAVLGSIIQQQQTMIVSLTERVEALES